MIPKSLHTVRVLVVMAGQTSAYAKDARRSTITPEEAVKEAAFLLGYNTAEDEYGLISKAVAQLEAAHGG